MGDAVEQELLDPLADNPRKMPPTLRDHGGWYSLAGGIGWVLYIWLQCAQYTRRRRLDFGLGFPDTSSSMLLCLTTSL